MAGNFSLPTTLANLAAGNQPLSLIDGDFTAVYNPLVALGTFSNYYTDTGAANAYVITVSAPQTVALAAGLRIQFLAAHINTGASTLQINALAAKNILNLDGSNLGAGQIAANAIIDVIYDGTQFLLLSAMPTRYKVGAFTYAMATASGNVSYTGIGFRPKAVLFLANVINGAVNASSKGFDDGTSRFCLVEYTTTGANAAFSVILTNSIYLFDDAGTANVAKAVVNSFDVDGFTLAWTKVNTPGSTANIGFLAFR